MATAIKAIPTLKGKERDDHSFCQMAHAILSKAGML